MEKYRIIIENKVGLETKLYRPIEMYETEEIQPIELQEWKKHSQYEIASWIKLHFMQ